MATGDRIVLNGQAPLDELPAGFDVREIRDTLNTLIRAHNREIEFKLPSDATKSIKVLVTDSKITFDFTQLGVVTTGCDNGLPKQITMLCINSPSDPP